MKKPSKSMRTINTVFLYVILSLVAVLVIYPLLYVFGSAFSPQNSLQGMGINPFSAEPTLLQFKKLFHETRYLSWYRNTLIVAGASCLCTVAITTVSAYVFSRFRFPMRKQMMSTFLILQIFPSFVGMVAIYVIASHIGGLDQLWCLVLVYVAGNLPYNLWLVKGYMDSIPKSFDEAARVDGASAFLIFRKVILPIARPITVFLAITSFTGPWMDFIFPRMILRSEAKTTLAVGLFQMISSRSATHYTQFAAGALLVAVPFILLFVLGQKSMMTAFGAAGVKE